MGLSSPARILVIDDDADVRKAAGLLLGRHGMEMRAAATQDEALSLLAAGPVDAILLDLNFSPGARTGAEGLACLARLLAHDPDAPVVVVTGHSGIAIAVAAMRAGAADFVMKPWSGEKLIAALDGAIARRRRHAEILPEAAPAAPGSPLIGESRAFREAVDRGLLVAASDAAILITGAAGTGKTALAELVHRHSARAGPLVVLDAAALWAEGDAALREGLAGVNDEGTLLLEGVELLTPPLQARLLPRLLRQPGPRLLATARATRAALEAVLLADLLYRLATIEIVLPGLRERDADSTLLARHFLRLFAQKHRRPVPELTPEAEAALAAAPWPGQVRELRLAMERAVLLGTGAKLQAVDVLAPGAGGAAPAGAEFDLNLARQERASVEAALRRHGFNVSRAAKELGLTRTALYRRMARHGL